jgi:hypothetical protein
MDLRSIRRCALALALVLAAACGSPKPKDSPETKDPSPAGATGSQGAMMSNMPTLDRAARMQFEDYNPDHIIEAVNALQPLGKQKSLELIKSYLDKRDRGNDATGLFWVLRVLFDVPASPGFPPVRIGQPDIPPPASAEALPRFPIALVNDVPLLLVRGYALGGFPEPVDAHLTYFQTHGTIRPAPLAPRKDGIADELARVLKTAYAGSPPDLRGLIGEQIARMK